MYVYSYVRIHIYTYIHICTYICTHTHTTHTQHTHTHTHNTPGEPGSTSASKNKRFVFPHRTAHFFFTQNTPGEPGSTSTSKRKHFLCLTERQRVGVNISHQVSELLKLQRPRAENIQKGHRQDTDIIVEVADPPPDPRCLLLHNPLTPRQDSLQYPHRPTNISFHPQHHLTPPPFLRPPPFQ